ncbi:MAG: hypothetical protein OEW11_00190 [Nitrospirota bacterium]|nr:hypothetical protein [Nitrospirota bacterium]
MTESTPSAATGARTWAQRTLRRLLPGRPQLDPRLWWILFAVLFGAGALVRGLLTTTLGIPSIGPDSFAYLTPALASPWLPLSEPVTLGEPYLIALSLALFHHPMGFLVVNNLLWAVSTLAIVLTLRFRLGLRAGSLALLACLSLVHANLGAEYELLSEHPARALTLLFLAALIRAMDAPWRIRNGAVLSLLVLASILIRPTGVVLAVALGIAYTVFWLRTSPALRGGVVLAAGVGACLLAAGLATNALLFKARFGDLGLTHHSGVNLYSHVAQYTDLTSPTYPDIKAGLREILPAYKKWYTDRGIYCHSWVAFGIVRGDIARDFGDHSPRSVVDQYIDRYPGTTPDARRNRIFQDLAVEGIRAHPTAYLIYAANRTALMLSELPVAVRTTVGPDFSPMWLRAHLRSAGQFTHLLDPDGGSPLATSSPGLHTWQTMGGSHPWQPPYATSPGAMARYDTTVRDMAPPVMSVTRALQYLTAPALLALTLLLIPLTWHRLDQRLLLVLGACLMIVFGHSLLHGLVNTADASRYIIPVRDLWVVAMVIAFTLAPAALRRLALAGILFTRRAGRNTPPSPAGD